MQSKGLTNEPEEQPLLDQDIEDIPEKVAALRVAPDGRQLTIRGSDYWCYTFEEQKEIGHIIVDYKDLWFYTIYLQEIQTSLENEITFLSGRAELWKTEVERQRERNEFLSKLWDSEHKLRLKLEQRSNTWRTLPWVIVAIESVVFAAVSTYSVIEAKN